MTPQLIQSIDLLQMTIVDLEKYLDIEVEKNPFIEKVYPEYKKGRLNTADLSVTDVIENTAQADSSDIYSYLLSQLSFITDDDKEHKILEYLILNIDESGYLNIDVEAVAKQFTSSPLEIEKQRQKLKWFDPSGVGARNLEESLLWQGIKAFPNDDIFHDFIRNYLQDVAKQDWIYIAGELDISEQEVIQLYEQLLQLNPRPMNQYAKRTEYIVPDIVVTHEPDKHSLQIKLQDEFLPELHFNHSYFDKMVDSKEVRQFKSENLNHYKQLIYSLTKRQSTLKDVTMRILEKQLAFLENGFVALKPMTMKEVGQSLSIHESTVSRAIKNKTIQTDKGIFELRALFSKNVSAFGERDISQAMVKAKIKQWIIDEDKYQPLSDQKIVELCATEHITISRRAIAKYRQMMHIPSSTKRKLKNGERKK